MNHLSTGPRGSASAVKLLGSALLGLALALGISSSPSVAMAAGHGDKSPVSAVHSRIAFHDAMRKLWEDHVTWTRLAIVTFADGSGGFSVTAGRLLQNQVEIGNAIKPFYGDAAGTELTALLHDHITIAVEVLQDAKTGDAGAFASAKTRWYANANQIADFLSAANPRAWPDDVMRADMKTHVDQLSAGIIQAFPASVR